MCFIHSAQWSTLCFNWVISIWALQWAILCSGFWHSMMSNDWNSDKTEWKKLPITLESLIVGDFGAAAAMITFGALLGKVNLY